MVDYCVDERGSKENDGEGVEEIDGGHDGRRPEEMGGGEDLSGPGLNERRQFPWTVILRAMVQRLSFHLHIIGRHSGGAVRLREAYRDGDEKVAGMA